MFWKGQAFVQACSVVESSRTNQKGYLKTGNQMRPLLFVFPPFLLHRLHRFLDGEQYVPFVLPHACLTPF